MSINRNQFGKILFKHLAKTGGTTILNHFRQSLDDHSVCVVGPHNRCSRFFSGKLQIEELSSDELSRFMIIQGHRVDSSSIRLIRDHNIRPMVVLREPVSLTRSRYSHRAHAATRKDLTVDPEVFIHKHASNSMSKAMVAAFPDLVDQEAQTLFDKAISVLRKFNYVYTTENMSRQLCPMLEYNGMPMIMAKKRVAEKKIMLPLSDSDIRAANGVDLALYALFDNDVVYSDGLSHNALGFDKVSQQICFQNIVNTPLSIEERKRSSYKSLASALCAELRGEAALSLIKHNAPIPVMDKDCFHEILEKAWGKKKESLSPSGIARAKKIAAAQQAKLSREAKKILI